LTNSSALSALQSLNMTQQAMATTQNQVSSGLAVASAADNAAYWSIGTQLTSDSGVVTAANSALSESQAVFDTATSAVASVITTINAIQTALTEATNPGADITNINTSLIQLGKQLTDAVSGASFNGLNLLNGSQTTQLNFVAGFNASSTGGSFNNISFNAASLTGSGSVSKTTQLANVTDAPTIAAIQGLTDNTAHVTAASYGQNMITSATNTVSVASVAVDGAKTTMTYSGLDASGNATTVANAVAFGVSETTTPAAGLLTQTVGATTTDLTHITTSATLAGSQLTAVEQALQAVTNYAAQIGAVQSRMTSASNLNSALITNYANGVGSLVDADMNVASTRLQALQTQEQLGIQSLSIANQNSQLILKLFNG
jgi:flagellin